MNSATRRGWRNVCLCRTGNGSVCGWTVRRRGKAVRRWRWRWAATAGSVWRQTACRPCDRWRCRATACRRNSWTMSRLETDWHTGRPQPCFLRVSCDTRSVNTTDTHNNALNSLSNIANTAAQPRLKLGVSILPPHPTLPSSPSPPQLE